MKYLLAFLGAAVLAAGPAAPQASGAQRANWPVTPVRTIPAAMEFGKKQGDLSPSEVRFIARNLSVVALEHFGAAGRPYATFDDGVAVNAAKLKAVNPSLKVLEYWGFAGRGHMAYHAYSDPEYLAGKAGWYTFKGNEKKGRLDITKPEVRVWWARQAALMVARGKLDGLFIDGTQNKPGDPWREAKIAMFKELRADLDKIDGSHKLVIINGNAPNFFGSGLAPYVDGVMIEFFDLVYKKPRSVDQTLGDLQAAYDVSKAGKMVWLKAWPYPHSFLDRPWYKGTEYNQKIADMRAPLAWNVAAFLVAQNPGDSFLFYSWGYSLDSMEVVRNHDADPATWDVDEAWYAELRHAYGGPIGPLTINGSVVSRSYPGGIASVDLQAHTASLPRALY